MKKQNEAMDDLLHQLIEDSNEYRNLEVTNNAEEKKNVIRSLMNIRMPRTLPEKLIKVQDMYLQEELALKGIVSLSEIPTVREQYKSNHPFADKLSIWQGDITRPKVGAIVNAANSQMLGCFVPRHRCIDNAIHSGAGMQLRAECNHMMSQRRIKYGRQYEEPTGTATLTKGYNLPCDYIIHTVGPIVHGKLTDSLRQDLQSCYENVLKCCMKNGIESVAFCCISTGEFHFPNDEAAKIAVETVTKFLDSNTDFHMDRIIFNVFKDNDRVIYEKIIGPN